MIRTGIGGWTYPEWRGGLFYPEGLAHKRELEWASRQVGAIEINATFYRLQKPASFRQWREATPEGFVFTLKGSRFITNRKVLASAAEPMGRFFAQGIEELGDRLGPILWQMAATKRFEADDMAAFMDLLPRELAGQPLRHAIEVGHESFACAAFVHAARAHNVAIVWSESPDRVMIDERTSDFRYLRCQQLDSGCVTGYAPSELDRIAKSCATWGEEGDVFAFMINGAKERAPAAALALARRITG